MRNMRSPLPVIIFIGIALFAVIGIIVLESSAKSASTSVINTTAYEASLDEYGNTTSEDLPVGIYTVEYSIMFGLSALILLIAGYFALRAVIT